MSAPWEAMRAGRTRGGRATGEVCAHCGLLQVGHGRTADRPLCHPDQGLDCYRLVTVYRHPMPCGCRGPSDHPDVDVCDECGYRRFEHIIDADTPRRTDFLGNPVPCWEFTPKPRPADRPVERPRR